MPLVSRPLVILALSIVLVAMLGFFGWKGFHAIYQAGWDARGKLALQERDATLAANMDASRNAAQTLSAGSDAAQKQIETLSMKLQEIENAPTQTDGACGIGGNSLRELEAIQ